MIYINGNIKLLFFVIYLHSYCVLHVELLHGTPPYTIVYRDWKIIVNLIQWCWSLKSIKYQTVSFALLGANNW